MTNGGGTSAWRQVPYVGLFAMLFTQTLATMAAYSLSAAAPAVAADLGVDGVLIGYYVSLIYAAAAFTALLSPGFVYRFGSVRVSQVIILATIGMILVATIGGTVAAIAASAVVLAIGYGATAPSSSHLLIKRTPPEVMNIVFSIRQIGVPLGGVLSGLIVPPLVLAYGWGASLQVQVIPCVIMLLLLAAIRRTYDADRQPARRIFQGGMFRPVRLLRELPEMRWLAVAAFLYSGAQLCFGGMMTVHLTSEAGVDLIKAGIGLAVYQIAGVSSRPVWGWLADNVISARMLLALQGLIMAGAAVAAGMFGPDWAFWAILTVAAVAGATASGYTGIAFAEFARIGGRDAAAEATGLGASLMFFGVGVMPSLFSLVVQTTGRFDLAYEGVALLTAFAGIMLIVGRR